jgi:hypothetical protein
VLEPQARVGGWHRHGIARSDANETRSASQCPPQEGWREAPRMPRGGRVIPACRRAPGQRRNRHW